MERLIRLCMYRAGLVSNVSRECQKDSPDFVLIGTLDGKKVSSVVEIKSRCSSIAATKEIRRLNSKRNCSCVSSYSNELLKHALKNLKQFR